MTAEECFRAVEHRFTDEDIRDAVIELVNDFIGLDITEVADDDPDFDFAGRQEEAPGQDERPAAGPPGLDDVLDAVGGQR